MTPEESAAFKLFVHWTKAEIGVPDSFLTKINSDDDWTMVIKLHAMLEAALNRLITGALKEPRLSGIVDRLDTSDIQRGKLAFVKALDLLSRDVINFIRKLSELRNSLVHDVRNFEFSLDRWMADMEEPEKKSMGKWISAFMTDDVVFNGQSMKPSAAVRQYPRYVIAYASFTIMAMILARDLGYAGEPQPE